MEDEIRLKGSLSENILILLCFDTSSIPFLISNIDSSYFESEVYIHIASVAIDYYNIYKKAIAGHLPDLLENVLSGKNQDKADLYDKVLSDLIDNKDSVNSEFVINRLCEFKRTQNLKSSIRQAAELVQNNDIDKAEVILREHRNAEIKTFDPGTFLKDSANFLSFLDRDDSSFKIGIEALDNLGVRPAPKELFLFVALPGYGKSWFLTHCGKFLMLQRKKVLHITLEMSEDSIKERYMKSLFAVSRDPVDTKLVHPTFSVDNNKRLTGIDIAAMPDSAIKTIKSFKDHDIREYLAKKIQSLKVPQIVVKSFPTGMLTINMLKSYLENLNEFYSYHPDVIILDYADCMRIDPKNMRMETSAIYTDLRGIACEYNIAMITASQANREGADNSLLTKKNLAESFAKAAIADNMVMFNQTNQEKSLGLARLFVDKSRNHQTGGLVLLSQLYDIGQFCIDNAYMGSVFDNNYWDMLSDLGQVE